MPSFQYDLNPPRLSLTDQQLLNELTSFAASVNNRPFTMAEFNARPCPRRAGTSRRRYISSESIRKRFGSWRTALRRIGIEHSNVRSYSPEELIDRLDQAWRQLGRPPGVKSLHQLTGLSYGVFASRWGSIRTACEMLAQFHKGQITREALLRGSSAIKRRPNLPSALRYQVLERDHFRCTCCGANPAADPNVILEVDHIKPVCQGGTDELENLRTLCRDCNRGKAGRERSIPDAKTP